jgi:phosphohistidine phosphatase
MKLLVIRHALAMDKEDFLQISKDLSSEGDRLRPLTAQGFKKMNKAAAGLKKNLSDVEVLISSPLVRAVQTSEVLVTAYELDSFIQTEALAPESSVDELFSYLQTFRQESLAVVGHEPQLSSFIAYALTGAKISLGELRKGGACLIKFPHGLKPGEGHLQWWLTNRQLREI